MSDRAAFLAAVRAAPDDDLPRLVFADWLDERGDPLGEFVRVQLELEPLRDHLDDPRVRDLMRREADLLARHRDEWAGPAADLEEQYPQFGPVFVRGFPERACVSLDTLLARGGELFAACPTLREVAVYDVAGRGDELADCPHLAHVETLEIADWLDENDRRVLMASGTRLGGIPSIRMWLGNPDDNHQYSGWHGVPKGCRDCEFVQLFSGVSSGEHPADRLRLEWAAKELVKQVNGLVGRQIARVTRPPDRMLPLAGDLGYGMLAGRYANQPKAQPVIVGVWVGSRPGPSLRVMSLPQAPGQGNSSQIVELAGPIDVTRAVAQHIPDFVPQLVRTCEFNWYGGPSIRLWPRSYVNDYLRNPFSRPRALDERQWRNRGGEIRRWLEQGRFVIEWDGREFHADKTGTIVTA